MLNLHVCLLYWFCCLGARSLYSFTVFCCCAETKCVFTSFDVLNLGVYLPVYCVEFMCVFYQF